MANNPLLGSFGDISGSSLMFRNKLINGNFDIWQRGTTATLTNGFAYVADRWKAGAASGTFSRGTFTLGQTAVPNNPIYYGAWTINSNSQNYEFVQFIESVATLAGQPVTVSFWARRPSGTVSISARLIQDFGTGGSPSTIVMTSLGGVSLTSSWQKFTFTTTLPSISGKTLGTNNNDNVWLSFQVTDTGTGEINFSQVQVEAGSVATPFEQRPIGAELALCQRYYWTPAYNTTETDFPRIRSSLTSGNSVQFNIVLPVSMRSKPTLTGAHTTDYRIFAAGGGAGLTISSASVIKYNNNHVTVEVIATSGAGDAVLAFNVAGSGLCGFNSEL